MEQRLIELELRDEEREKEVNALREKERRREEAAEERRIKEQADHSRVDLSPDLEIYAGRGAHDEDDPVDVSWPRPARAPRVSTNISTPLVVPGQSHPITETAEQAASTEHAKDPSTTAVDEEHDDPPLEMTAPDPKPSDLPSYVLLVGIGVCAVVLRVLFRKMGSGRRV